MHKCCIYVDEDDCRGSINLLGAAERIYAGVKYETSAVTVNHRTADIEGRFDRWISVRDARIGEYDISNVAGCLEELHRMYDFDCILIPATFAGRMLAPRLAVRLGIGLVADVTGIEHDGCTVEMIRPAYYGMLAASVIDKNCRPLMMSIRPNAFACAPGACGKTETISYTPARTGPTKVELLEKRHRDRAEDIRESRVLISGGGGVADHFDKLWLLAGALGGMVSASRRTVDSGRASRSIQVGQSGKTVSPELYFALGIRGSYQHIEGLKNVKYIISVNTDRDAPINSVSDVVVHGDAVEFIDRMVEKIDYERIT
ncbi:MAG: electron transfer flavoprotein subunit alpha/FixB family protein [Spirochaetota bacterium]